MRGSPGPGTLRRGVIERIGPISRRVRARTDKSYTCAGVWRVGGCAGVEALGGPAGDGIVCAADELMGFVLRDGLELACLCGGE